MCVFVMYDYYYFFKQLKSMVSALYNSGGNCTRHFDKDGTHFGWSTIRDLWQREVNRSEKGQMAVIPRMKASYVFRDSWTRLNVTPARITQVHLCILYMVHKNMTHIFNSARESHC